ncbi:MAG: tyrosinase family protein [Bryobacteraceae bacterium]
MDETTPEFGGPDTTALGCFWHGGGKSSLLENNPHNQVHNYVGGPNTEGLMGDPGLAALDPIFYLHHADIEPSGPWPKPADFPAAALSD